MQGYYIDVSLDASPRKREDWTVELIGARLSVLLFPTALFGFWKNTVLEFNSRGREILALNHSLLIAATLSPLEHLSLFLSTYEPTGWHLLSTKNVHHFALLVYRLFVLYAATNPKLPSLLCHSPHDNWTPFDHFPSVIHLVIYGVWGWNQLSK
ncbi:hypothetical protein F4703DRAFT_1799096 [Phycomyces blakesleeanus]